MHRPIAICLTTTTAMLCMLTALPSAALGGGFTVASCQADRINYSTIAFEDFANRGMKIRRACNPEGRGIRGLVTGNVYRRGIVRRDAVAVVAIPAPEGTHFTRFRWAGSVRRSDCRYALELFADGPGIAPVRITNVKANEKCAARAMAVQAAGYEPRTFNVTGATRIVQQVICKGGRGTTSCSAQGQNYIRTYKAEVEVVDDQPPTVTITGDTPLAAGAWVSGNQQLNYDAQDNVGVRVAQATLEDRTGGSDVRSCSMATAEGAYASSSPCPNGVGTIRVPTTEFAEGTHPLVVQARDVAGNEGTSPPVTVRIDNAAPARTPVSVVGGEGWRNRNDFAVAWSDPPEGDRAPIAGALYRLCAVLGGACTSGEQAAESISSLAVQVPAPGEWAIAVWRRDAAGNADPALASEPVTLRYDPEPPQLAFDASLAADPTLVAAPVIDKVSGLADGAIEISAAGSDTWRTLQTSKDASRLVARIDDATLPAGPYRLRAIARDHAGNEASTTLRADGQPMTLTLPLRIATTMHAGLARTRVVSRIVRRNGKRRTIQRRMTELRPAGVVRLGRRAQIRGRLTNSDGQGIAGAEVQVLSRSDGPEQLAGVVHTDTAGAYAYTATGSANRTLRFVYAGSALILPAQSSVRIVVPAVTTLRVSRRSVLNGDKVMFTGRVLSRPIPSVGKLVALEVLLPDGWQTFRTVRADQRGRWRMPYRFGRTTGVEWYRFRASLPRESGYPFAAGASPSLRVRVQGTTR